MIKKDKWFWSITIILSLNIILAFSILEWHSVMGWSLALINYYAFRSVFDKQSPTNNSNKNMEIKENKE